MFKGSPKCRYTTIFIIFSIAFICGLNYKKWYATNHLVTKRVFLAYSLAKDEIGNGNLEKHLLQKTGG